MSDSLCQNCGQHPATFHYTITDGAGTHNIHLCEHCVSELGDIETLLRDLADAKDGQPNSLRAVTDLVARLLGTTRKMEHTSKMSSSSCPVCGLSLQEFRNGGCLGCPTCYTAFAAELEQLIPRLHEGGRTHRGKTPSATDRTLRQCLELESKLVAAINAEDYERAARLRDELTATRRLINR